MRYEMAGEFYFPTDADRLGFQSDVATQVAQRQAQLVAGEEQINRPQGDHYGYTFQLVALAFTARAQIDAVFDALVTFAKNHNAVGPDLTLTPKRVAGSHVHLDQEDNSVSPAVVVAWRDSRAPGWVATTGP